MAERRGRRWHHVLCRSSAILLLCLLLSQRAEATDAVGTTAPSTATDDDVTDYSTRRETSALPSFATLTSKGSRGGDLLMENVQSDVVSLIATAVPENGKTLQNPASVSTALESPRQGGGPLQNLLPNIGGNLLPGIGGNGGSSGVSPQNTMMIMMGTILVVNLMMLMPLMLLKSASELLESLVSLGMKVFELVLIFLKRKSGGQGDSNGKDGGGDGSGAGGGGRGKEATHKQVLVLQLPKDPYESWSIGHLPNAIGHYSYGGGPHHDHGWSDEHGFLARSYHPLEWSPHHSAGGWQDWSADNHHHNNNHQELWRRNEAGNSLAYRYWNPGV